MREVLKYVYVGYPKPKYNIAQNQSFVQIGVGIIILEPQLDPSHQFLCLFEPYSRLVFFFQ